MSVCQSVCLSVQKYIVRILGKCRFFYFLKTPSPPFQTPPEPPLPPVVYILTTHQHLEGPFSN